MVSTGNARTMGSNIRLDTMAEFPQETTRLLADSARIAGETEEIGARTAESMLHQREMLDDAGDHISSMMQLAKQAKTSMQRLQRSRNRKALILWAVIIFLMLANLAVIVTLIKHHGRFFN